jgi:hypothetical protein
MPRRTYWILLAALVIVALHPFPPALALETDQFYTWGRPIADSTDVLNAKVNSEIALALDELNAGRLRTSRSCEKVSKKVMWRLRFLIFHEIEMWALNSPLVARIPSTPEEELHYRKVNLYGNHGPLDIGTSIPTSPTIQVHGVRFGTDKLSHFISSGWRYHLRYHRALRKGATPEEAEQRAIRRGILFEKTILGAMTSGVFSRSDLEANYQGMRFFIDLCDGESPLLARTDEGWTMARPIDFRNYVVPEWDESFQTSTYSKGRWRKVRPVLIRYCSLLENAEYLDQLEAYRLRDRLTPTEVEIEEQIREGRLRDPQDYFFNDTATTERAKTAEAASPSGAGAAQTGTTSLSSEGR